MKRILLLCLLAICLFGFQGHQYCFFQGSFGTCTSLTSNSTNDTTQSICRYTGQEYYGFVFDDSSSGTICQVDVYIYDMQGTASANDYYVEIWLLDGSDNLSSLVTNGRSDKVDGAAWSAESVTFTFSTNPTYDCTGGNQYGILIKSIDDDDAASTAGEFDGTNYPRVRYNNAANSMTHCESLAYWDSGDSAADSLDATDMPYMEVHTIQ